MTATPCHSHQLPDAACHKDVPFRGYDAGEIEAKRAKKLADVKKYAPRYLRTFQRAFAGNSLRAAVNAFCIECVGFIAGDVSTCTVPDCPLFSSRPGRHPDGGVPDSEVLPFGGDK